MKLQIKIEEDIYKQFSEQLKVKEIDNYLQLDTSIGEGKITCSKFPTSLQFYHFKLRLNHSVALSSFNSAQSDYLLLNINLSEKEIAKNVNGEELHFQKYLPSGILLYPPDTTVVSNSPAKTHFKVVLIKFHKKLLSTYFEQHENLIQNMGGAPFMKTWIFILKTY